MVTKLVPSSGRYDYENTRQHFFSFPPTRVHSLLSYKDSNLVENRKALGARKDEGNQARLPVTLNLFPLVFDEFGMREEKIFLSPTSC